VAVHDKSEGPDDEQAWLVLAVAVRAVLVERGPLTTSALLPALSELGLAAVEERDIEDLLDAGDIAHVVQLDSADESVFFALDALLADRVFTHRLTATEIADHTIDVTPDLGTVMMLTEAAPYDQLEDGSAAEPAFIGEGMAAREVLVVPPAALAGYADGDLIGLGATASGLRIVAVQQLSVPPDGLADRVVELIAANGDPKPMMLDYLIYELCIADPDLLTLPLAPLGELLDAWGLERRVDHVAPVGFDFDNWGVAAEVAELSETYDITADQAMSVRLMTQDFRRTEELAARLVDHLDAGGVLDGQRPIGAGEAAPALADPAVAEAFFWETVGIGVPEAGVMLALTNFWSRAAPSRLRPALAWLQGKSHERLGDVTSAEAAYERSLDLDPFFGASLVDLSRYAGDRGDATRAISLLERAGFTQEDPFLARLLPYQATDRPEVGRNDPCWCGSGRKYKRCHLGKVELSESARADWLRQKVVLFAHDPPQGAVLVELAAIRTEHLHGDPAEAIDDPVVLDVALYDGDVLEAFAELRGALLPSEERSLLAAWSAVKRSVVEVLEVRVGRGLTVRDLQTGEQHQLDDVAAIALTGFVPVGQLLLTRLLAVGGSVATFGFFEPVTSSQLDESPILLALEVESPADPYEVMAELSARFRPVGAAVED